MVKTSFHCRGCDAFRPCYKWTVHEHEVDNYYQKGTETTGRCDDCLKSRGPDQYCCPPEEQDEAQARAEAEYRDLDQGEL